MELPAPTLINSKEIPTLQASSQGEYKNNSNMSDQFMREQRRLIDGSNWRKYGQKKVKGSENPRSYYKCTHPNCATKKKIERSLDGHITEIIYKGTHNHPKPDRTRRNSSSFQSSIYNEGKYRFFNGEFGLMPMDSITTENNSSASFGDEDNDMNSYRMLRGGDDYDEDETEDKKWKMEGEDEGISNQSNRTVREPKVVVQTTSDIDILDDGYWWRKYGHKVVKGNPNPRSYYKCTTSGCSVRKHVERASTDLKAVIMTYEGKHNHDVPAQRGGGFFMNYNNNNKGNYAMTIRPSEIGTRPIQMASDAFFRYDNSMNSSFSNHLQHLQNQGHNMFSKAKAEPRDDLFIDLLRS